MEKNKQYEPLYRRLLGDNYEKLPHTIRKLHDLPEQSRYIGKCHVQRGKNFLARAIASLLSLPRSGNNIPIKLHFEAKNNVEHWTRYFNNHKFYSKQWQQEGLLFEKLPTTTLVFSPFAHNEGLELKLEQVYFLGIPVISLFKPKVIARESEKNGLFHFYVRVTMPSIGIIVTYEGYLKEY